MLTYGGIGLHHFSLLKQRLFIQSHGEQVLVWPVLQCPCLLDDRQFSPVCTTCHGTGRFYPPDTAYGTMLLLVHETSQRDYNDPGTWTAGTIQATMLPGIRLAERDKVRRLDIKETFTDEVLTRGLDEQVRFTSGVDVTLLADRQQVYVAGRDYTVSADGMVTWTATGMQPAFGEQYALKYLAYPEYLCSPDSPRARAEHRLPQAQVVTLHRLDRLSEDF